MHVRVNAATSVDGKLSTRHRTQVPISGQADFERVDRLRADSDAVMVGVGTVLADDPSLTVDADRHEARRERGETANPDRVVADSRARTPTDARVLDGSQRSEGGDERVEGDEREDDASTTYVLVSEAAPADRRRGLAAAGAEVIVAGEERVDLAAAFELLEAHHGVESIMVEGGGELLFSCFEAGLVDELSVFVGSTVIGGRDAPTLVDGEGFGDVDSFVDLDLERVERVDDGVLLHWQVSDGES
ncbi:2,5-diamino-6-(ribosylamino)-4(3H)-pyrimidinone 5'-phosphate reductase [Salinarchaeum laminariae]|uniref:2,5-diamino-6-(ribosylamino)-4(3H)-pyrimidinone 5'-phosphate reductase n=1 Tax=Salinarchaeum laminariae TaxID=869888 RepID=UPI0020BE1DE8|nr:2,5-diamino-6-(ribosylamino)-4(3H)-pyrimidinone 5'-phosphate reductase [Salinarchaeum laminariae]